MTASKLGLSLLAVGLIGGALAGAAVSVAMAPEKKAVRPTKEEPSNLNEELAVLRRRVTALEAEVSTQRNARIGGMLRQATAARGSAGAAATAAKSQQAAVVDDPVFEVAVRDVVDRIQEEREADRELARDERRRAMAKRWADDLNQKLSLNDAQRGKVQTIVQEFFDKMRDARNADAGAGTNNREERRARLRELREQTDRRLAEVLDRSQMQKYEQLGEESRLGGRGMGPRRGR